MVNLRTTLDKGNFNKDLQKLSYAILRELKVGEKFIKKVQDCEQDTFYRAGDLDSENEILKEDNGFHYLMGVHNRPSITINNSTYKGDLLKADVSRALCTSFKERPDVCQGNKIELLMGTDNDFLLVDEATKDNTLLQIFIAGCFLIFINIGMIMIHKKFSTSTQRNEISHEVSAAVSQYFALRGDDPSDTRRQYELSSTQQ
uniref:Uncharacterized protein n=1 Tax=Strombidium inclinatum TaxID=197538 RepID=A0A7S3IG49_9SPIT|mmetsp:Transcript_13590/g.21234  ORF Transcript_13590/g.21234 Transcript_13590/m.21234 type:complete len:202 (+) Transcript_13590:935-1540(+)